MDARRGSCSQYEILISRFGKCLPCTVSRNLLLLVMVRRFFFADGFGFLQNCGFLMSVCERDSYKTIVPQNDYAIGWEDFARNLTINETLSSLLTEKFATAPIKILPQRDPKWE